MRTLLAVLLTCAFFLSCTVVALFKFSHQAIIGKQGLHYIYLTGTPLSQLAENLHQKGELNHPWMLVLYADISGHRRQLKAGEYIFPPLSTAKKVLDQLAAGDVAHHQITFIEGWTLAQDLSALESNPEITHTLKNVNSAQLAKLLNITQDSAEGWIYPATYYYSHAMSDITILRRAHDEMEIKLQQAWPARASNLPYKDEYQALIVASLIQREAYYTAEMPEIAGVIINRLKRNMPLQIDATVIYGLNQKQHISRVTYQDLKIKTAYNTYLIYGLPPTPIAQPGLAAIEAALHPKLSNNLYYVAEPNGHHIFSETLEQHDEAIRWIKGRQ